MTLEGKGALVTGAGQGIGRAIAMNLARQGADLAVVDINQNNLYEVSSEIKKLGRRCLPVVADISNIPQIIDLIASTTSFLGKLDIAVNNAATTSHIDFLDISEDDWEKMTHINGKGTFFCMQKEAAQMIVQGHGGRIINIASVAGRGYPKTSNAAYAATKGSVIAMTYIGSQLLGKHGINVNAICPGMTKTGMLEGIISKRSIGDNQTPDQVENDIAKHIPIGRINTPDDIARLATFLAGPGARNITGQALNVDGGLINS